MKTYTKTIEKPRLVIEYDTSGISPREDDNLGYFITVESRYQSPDNDTELTNIVYEEQHGADNVEQHAENIKTRIEEERGETVKAIYPVYRYEHGNVVYRRGTASGFDYSNCGFYIVTDKTQDVLGTPDNRIEAMIDSELDCYTKYANGEMYCYTLYNESGEVEDSCCGFYDIYDIKEYLPVEYKNDDLSDYLQE